MLHTQIQENFDPSEIQTTVVGIHCAVVVVTTGRYDTHAALFPNHQTLKWMERNIILTLTIYQITKRNR